MRCWGLWHYNDCDDVLRPAYGGARGGSSAAELTSEAFEKLLSETLKPVQEPAFLSFKHGKMETLRILFVNISDFYRKWYGTLWNIWHIYWTSLSPLSSDTIWLNHMLKGSQTPCYWACFRLFPTRGGMHLRCGRCLWFRSIFQAPPVFSRGLLRMCWWQAVW